MEGEGPPHTSFDTRFFIFTYLDPMKRDRRIMPNGIRVCTEETIHSSEIDLASSYDR